MEDKELQLRLSKPFAYKSAGNVIKDVDNASRTVVFYSNAFDKMDDQNDIIRKGAFAKTIKEWGPGATGTRKVKHCLFHDETQMPGVITELSEDSYGLRVAVKMADTTLGRDTLEAYKDGIYTEHSIRMGYIPGKIKKVMDGSVDKGHYYDVTEGRLWHTTTVCFGSNEYTPVIGFKSLQSPDDVDNALLTLNERMGKLTKAIRGGSYSDEAFKQIAYDLAECQDAYNSLITTKPVSKATLIEAEPNETEKAAKQPDYSFLKTFSIKENGTTRN